MNNEIEIRHALEMLYRNGDIVEMRVPRKPGVEFAANTAGLFNDLDKLAYAINYINTEYKTTVFTTMNPLAQRDWMTVNNRAYVGSSQMRKELEAANLPLEPRMNKSILWETGKEHWAMRMAEDEDVLKRRWILIDIDAGQKAGTNSSDHEHAMTLAVAKDVIDFLVGRGFPGPALTNSGNGHHVYVRVDLPNDPPSAFLVRRFLLALAQKFDDTQGTAKVDITTFNAARITKANGTMVFKGEHSLERPQRRSSVINFASKRIASAELLQEVANLYKVKEGETLEMWTGGGVAVGSAELQRQINRVHGFLDFYDIEYRPLIQQGSDLVMPITCPNSEEHTMDGGEMECVIMIGDTGALSFCCQHSHCQHFRGWKKFRAYMEATKDETYQWTPKAFISKDTFVPSQKTVMVSAEPTKQETAIALLQAMKLPILVEEAQHIAEQAGISVRTLQRAYEPAGVEYSRTATGDYLVAW